MARFSVAMALFDVTLFLIRAYNEMRLSNSSTFASRHSPNYSTSRRSVSQVLDLLLVPLLALLLIEDGAVRRA